MLFPILFGRTFEKIMKFSLVILKFHKAKEIFCSKTQSQHRNIFSKMVLNYLSDFTRSRYSVLEFIFEGNFQNRLKYLQKFVFCESNFKKVVKTKNMNSSPNNRNWNDVSNLCHLFIYDKGFGVFIFGTLFLL